MSALTDILLAPDVRPFAVAAAIMVALGGIELLATLVGFSLSHIGKDIGVETDSDSGLGGLFLWINAGRLPLLILIILALGVFSIAGFFLQGLAHGVGISVPASIDFARIKATLKSGILRVTAPKTDRAQAIPVEVRKAR